MALAAALICLLGLGGCARSTGTPGDLLAGQAPTRSSGVATPMRITDGSVAHQGDFWQSSLTAVFASRNAFAVYDLGKRRAIGAVYVQADANDHYSLSISDDDVHFAPLWVAEPVAGSGISARYTTGLRGSGRYVKLQASGGDGKFSVSELALYTRAPAVFPPHFTVRDGLPPDMALRSAVLVFGLSLMLFVGLTWRRAPLWWTIGLAALPIAAGAEAYHAFVAAWPVGAREVSLVRAVVAAVAAVAILREALAPPRWRAARSTVVATLGVCGVLAAAAFYNLGRPQFYDHAEHHPSYVHNFDMRVYYPVAKYFHELSYDGLYDASVAAYVDDVPNASLASLQNVPLRDLRTHVMTRVGDRLQRIAAVRARFKPARWAEFDSDMRYFQENMGSDYLGTMHDHGANATPAWLAIAHLIFAKTHASNITLLSTALLDPLLLALAFVAIGRSFGWRTMLVSLVVFGANDYYMFGTDWAGSTLRHDWMAYLALGLCAIKTGRHLLGGALLGLSSMMRAFPALALLGAAIPALAWLFMILKQERRLPSLERVRREQRAILRIAAGAALSALGLFLLSSVMFSPTAWTAWFHKVTLLNDGVHVNHVSLRALIGGPNGDQLRVVGERWPVYVAGIVAFVVLVFVAARKRSIEQAAIFGMVLLPVVFNPANYYIHFIFVLPLLAVELRGAEQPVTRADAAIWVLLLGLCAAQYGTVLVKDLGLHFYLATALLFVTLTTMLVSFVTRAPALAGVPGTVPEPAPASDQAAGPLSRPVPAESNATST